MINIDELNIWLPFVLSFVALFVTFYSMWRFHWRRGRLIVSPPRAFMVAEVKGKIILELPLSFYNDGAAAIVADNLLLLARQEKTRMLFRFEYTRDELGAETHHWATQIALAGREAVMKVFSFQANEGENNLSAGTWDCTLMAKMNHQASYTTLSYFKLNVSRLSAEFAAIDNTSAEYQSMVKRYTVTKK
jgi:hypothetical protein